MTPRLAQSEQGFFISQLSIDYLTYMCYIKGLWNYGDMSSEVSQWLPRPTATNPTNCREKGSCRRPKSMVKWNS